MIALYIAWNAATATIEVDAASPTSRAAIEQSPELQERISEAMTRVWKEIGAMPFLPPQTSPKGVSLIPPKGTWNLRIAVHKFQSELGADFTVGERPVA